MEREETSGSTPRRLRVAVIGLGIGKTHADRYARLPGAELVAVCDLDANLARQVAGRYGCDAYDDPGQLLEAARPNAVSLCTPPAAHPGLTALCAARGVHVLAEKPMASTVEGCQEMIATCRRHGVVLMVGHKKRFAPPLLRLRELTEPGGELGPVRQATVKYMHPGMSASAWFWDEADGGGPVLENHVHAADTLGFLAGEPLRVFAEGGTRFVSGRAPQPNVAAYAARFAGRRPADGDVIVSVGYGMVGPFPGRPLGDERWWLACEAGVAEVAGPFDNLQQLTWAPRERGATVREEAWPDADPFLLELEHFLDCVRTGAEPRAGGAAGMQAVRFCLGIKESVRSGRAVTF
jgi:predicted dehydrogenase